MKVKTLTRSKPKYKMKGRTKARTKAISVILILSLCLASVIQPLATSAGELGTSSTQMETEAGAFTPVRDATISAEKVVLKSADLKKTKDAVVLQYIGEEQFDRANHTMRLKQHEDLHTFVFQNLDGTRTLYVMDEDVKYIDANGDIIDKDISLVSKTKGFGIVQNEVDLLIPNSVQNGIDVAYNGYAIKLTPQGLVTRASAKKEDNSIVYEGAFGTNTSLKYTPLLSGIKEDIILSSYMPNVSYTFVLETDGLRVRQNEGRYYLVDPAKRDPVFYLGEILVYDAIGKPDMGTMTVTTVEEGQKYLLTITVDDDFLSDLTTEYPVTIDPSITISDSTTTGSIEDAPIFENYPNTNFGTYAYNRVGTPSAAYGVGRTVVRLKGLIYSNEYQNINASQVVVATFYATEASGGAPQMVELYPLTNLAWTESGVTWANVGTISGEIDSGAMMSYNREAEFDITTLVQAWKSEDSTLSAHAGFILKHSNESLNKAICSSEFSTASKRPRVVITYECPIYFEYPYIEIEIGENKKLNVVTVTEDCTITFCSSDPSIVDVNVVGRITAKKTGNASIVATAQDLNGNYYFTECEVRVYIPDGTYYLENKQTQYYASTGDLIVSTGINICQWEFAWDASQRWIFTNVGEGYYSIQTDNAFVPYYLSVIDDSATLNVDIVLRSGTLTDGMKWRIEKTINGAYKLIPKVGEANGYVLATSTSNAVNGAELIQGAYVNNNSYRDEWLICKFDYQYTVKYYYDEGYKVRYSDIDSNVENLIRSYHNIVAERFMRTYGIRITAEYYYYTSLADICKEELYGSVTTTTINEGCSHLNNHLTTDALRGYWYSGTHNTTVVLLTGHQLQEELYGDSDSLRHCVAITPYGTFENFGEYDNFQADKIAEVSTLVLMHELSHQLGAPDHYCYDKGGDENCDNLDCDECVYGMEVRKCLMNGDDDYTLALEGLYCSDCENIIKNHLVNHHLP